MLIVVGMFVSAAVILFPAIVPAFWGMVAAVIAVQVLLLLVALFGEIILIPMTIVSPITLTLAGVFYYYGI